MTEHKFTDEEVIKAFEKCISNDMSKCEGCPYSCWGGDCALLENNLLDLIKRQKAEIEDLQLKLAIAIDDAQNHTIERIRESTIRFVAVNEFAERLKERSCFYDHDDSFSFRAVLVEDIDNLVKEMIGEEK